MDSTAEFYQLSLVKTQSVVAYIQSTCQQFQRNSFWNWKKIWDRSRGQGRFSFWGIWHSCESCEITREYDKQGNAPQYCKISHFYYNCSDVYKFNQKSASGQKWENICGAWKWQLWWSKKKREEALVRWVEEIYVRGWPVEWVMFMQLQNLFLEAKVKNCQHT